LSLRKTPPPKPVPSEVKPINISGNTFVFNYRGGDTNTEIHVSLHEPPKVEERIVTHPEVETQQSRRPVATGANVSTRRGSDDGENFREDIEQGAGSMLFSGFAAGR
jgi:hypothetical protein